MKKKKKELKLINKLMEDANKEVSKVVSRIKPDIDRVVEMYKSSNTPYKSLLTSENRMRRLPVEQYQQRTRSVKNTVYLNDDGDLYRKDKETYCYNMHTAKIRLEIIKYLINHSDYNKVEDIREYTDSTSEKSVREAIRSINSNVSRHLNIKGFIESRQGSGYRINPKFEIVLE